MADPRFVGWIRTRWKHWEPIVRGDDLDDVWQRLLAHTTRDKDGARIVMPAGERPTVQRGPVTPPPEPIVQGDCVRSAAGGSLMLVVWANKNGITCATAIDVGGLPAVQFCAFAPADLMLVARNVEGEP